MKKHSSNEPPDENRNKQVTLRDIAAALGVSHVTVSLALRNHPRISEKTRDKVQKKAEEMGYHPDPMLSALSHYRLSNQEKPVQATLAWINPLKNPDELQKLEEFALYWKGAESVANRLGFNLEEFRTADLPLKRMNTIFKTRNIRGLVIAPLSFQVSSIDWNDFPWAEYAGVRFGRSKQGPRLHFVTSAQASNAIKAFEKARKKGYQRIGFLCLKSARRMFSAGYLKAQQNIPVNQRVPILTHESVEDSPLLANVLDEWLKREKPDAILTDSLFLPSMLEQLGYAVPKDICIATMSVHDTPIDAGIDQNPEEIGRAAIRTLSALLNEHHFGIPEIRNQTLVEGRWQDGSMLPVKREA